MAIQTETDLGKVAIMPKGEWVIGVLYEILDMVTHNGNLYLSLKDTSVEPTDDGINWMLLMEGVPVATDTILGKVKPDGKTITIENGTLHGASQVPEGVTYVDLEAENQELQAKLPVDADTLEGHAAEYFATKKDLENIDVSGGGGVTFPLEVPNSKEIKFFGLENPGSNYSKLLSHILYKDRNALVLKTVDEKTKEKELIRVYEDEYGRSIIYFEAEYVNMIHSVLQLRGVSLVDDNEDEITARAIATNNGSGLEICKDGSVYETLLEVDGDGISNFFHSVKIKGGNLYLDLQQGIIFSQEERGLRWGLKENSLKQLIFYGHNLDNEQIKNASVISWDNVSNNVDTCFNNLKVWFSRYFENFGHLIQEDTSTGKLNFKIYQNNAYITSASISKDGDWTFFKNINAPNIATTTELFAAQQEITEQDLQLIETQRMLTDQELENIETQQLLTEMDLEKIEGGQVI